VTDPNAKIAEALRGHTAPLAARLRGPAIAGLAARLAASGAQPSLAGLVTATPRVVATLHIEHAATLRRLAALEAEVHAAGDPAAQRQALARVIGREVRDAGRRSGDLRALRRDLDLDALRERVAGELAALEAQVELALGFVGRAAAATLATEPTSGPPLRRAGLQSFLLGEVTWIPRFTLRLAAVEALQRVCEALGPADPDGAIARTMRARVLDPEEHPWVQAAALTVLHAVAPAEGMQLCAEVLRAPHAGGGDAQGGVEVDSEGSQTGMLLESADDPASASRSSHAVLESGDPGFDVSWPDLAREPDPNDSVTAGAIEPGGDQPAPVRNTATGATWVSLIDRIDAEASARGPIALVPEPPGRDADRERRAVAGEIGETRDAHAQRLREPRFDAIAALIADGLVPAELSERTGALDPDAGLSEGTGEATRDAAVDPGARLSEGTGAPSRGPALADAPRGSVGLSEGTGASGPEDPRLSEGTAAPSRDAALDGAPRASAGLATGLSEGTGAMSRDAALSDALRASAGLAPGLSEGTGSERPKLSEGTGAPRGLSAGPGEPLDPGAWLTAGGGADLRDSGAWLAEGAGADTRTAEPGAGLVATADLSEEPAPPASPPPRPVARPRTGRVGAVASPAPVSAALRGRRAFLLRRLVVDMLARRVAERRAPAVAVDLLAEAIAAGDPSEHVRVGLALASGSLPAREMRAPLMLAALAAPLREPSPVVRAWALRAAASGPAGELLLERSLTEETSPLVLRVACAEAGARGGPTLVRALMRLGARDDRPAAVHEAAAAALEAVDRAGDPARAAWTAVLADALARTPPGGRVRVSLRRPDLPPPADSSDPGQIDLRWFGRIFAELTRGDWGVDVTPGRGHLTIRRGDRWRTRLWRVLHELRSPGPNKRQAFSHTRGRVLRGPLRAHSGVLHEVTGTGVPGERVQCEREGGWGRHLPLVDDLLGLPLLRARPVHVVSSHGVCTLTWRRGLLGRLAARLRMSARYAWLAELRQQALAATEPAQRGRYAQALRAGFGVELRFGSHPAPQLPPGADPARDAAASISASRRRPIDPADFGPRKLPSDLRALFPEVREGGPRLPPAGASRAAAAAWLVAPALVDWLWLHAHYFISVSANSQQALAYFLAGLISFGLIAAYLKNRGIARDRAAVPLVIGGWGTRGKSGTERLKAGLLHGLGYSVFAKTTGCEAMFIHAPPLGPAREIYSFRPYGKATIWEQRTLLGLAARMRSDVFLWECMALSPAYVQILQHAWMRDDLSTITNAYPDHEDIQGPAGMDVAQVIAGFVPTRGRLVTSEINFLPVMREAARQRGTSVVALEDLAGDLLPADLLGLFPYDEHPRNIALVARMAVELGLDPTLAIVTMAEHVVPDLGVLKRFGPVRVRGRSLEFINGCSANERTGFLSNWRRTGCDRLDLAAEPDRYVITVVNNRDDRVSRSQVFARVMVEDVAVDRHLIIGTNTQGLVNYVRTALDDFLAEQRIVTAEDLAGGLEDPGLPARRLDALLARLRVVPRAAEALAQQLDIFAQGAGRALTTAARAEVAERCAPWLAADASASLALAEVFAATRAELGAWAESLLAASPYAAAPEPPEVDAPASATTVAAHFARQVARTAIAARLHARLAAALRAGPASDGFDDFHVALRAAYRELFLDLLDVVEDPLTTGDQVVLRCALALPPGVRGVLMGTQNIKGTGLDFVYRWIAVDVAQHDLAALTSADPETRSAALRRLESPDDPGLLDAGLVAARLAARTPGPGEAELQARAQQKAEARHVARRAALGQQRTRRGRSEAIFQWLEGWVDFIDGARRHSRAKQVMRDLIDQRISHARAAQVMRELDARAKGGWLVKAMRRR